MRPRLTTTPRLKSALEALKARGYVPSARRGPTGVGYTLEKELGVSENNLPIPDIGGRVEVKSTRTNANSLITLFTFNKAVWQYKQPDIISRWGYVDTDGRQSLYNATSTQEENSQGLRLSVSEDADNLLLTHVPSSTLLAKWDMFHIIGKFLVKLERVLFVHADVRKIGSRESFHFVRAELLSEPSAQTFKRCFDDGKVVVDIRMHLRNDGSVRNRGTAFRIREHDLPSLYGKSVSLM